ncbi:MAG: hypothetical protein J1E04_00785 [Alistipes sp.]|nr:hypothetical protein [Alistipes sp.]
MKRTLYKIYGSIIITAAAVLTASAQEPQPQKNDGPQTGEQRESVAADDYDLEALPDITKWLPVEQFAQEMQAERTARFAKSSFSTDMVIPKRKIKAVVISPDNNSIRFGEHFSISNGSAGNWGVPYPSAYLDARTLSFPIPR